MEKVHRLDVYTFKVSGADLKHLIKNRISRKNNITIQKNKKYLQKNIYLWIQNIKLL